MVDAHRYPNCLAIRRLESVFGYNFDGTTDILLAYSAAVRGHWPEIGSVAAFVLKKGKVIAHSRYSAFMGRHMALLR